MFVTACLHVSEFATVPQYVFVSLSLPTSVSVSICCRISLPTYMHISVSISVPFYVHGC
jgi:hypothetical protein